MRSHRRDPVRWLAALLALTPGVVAGQAANRSTEATAVRVTGGAGMTIMHLPAFTFTRGAQRTPVQEPAQEGGGLTFTGGLEALRGRTYAGARYQLIVELLADDWYAHVGAVYAGLARRRPKSLLAAGLGATAVHRSQVTRQLAPGLCLYSGCDAEFRVNRDGGTITTWGALLTVVAERRVAPGLGVGVEAVAASGPQRYAGLTLRASVGGH